MKPAILTAICASLLGMLALHILLQETPPPRPRQSYESHEPLQLDVGDLLRDDSRHTIVTRPLSLGAVALPDLAPRRELRDLDAAPGDSWMALPVHTDDDPVWGSVAQRNDLQDSIRSEVSTALTDCHRNWRPHQDRADTNGWVVYLANWTLDLQGTETGYLIVRGDFDSHEPTVNARTVDDAWIAQCVGNAFTGVEVETHHRVVGIGARVRLEYPIKLARPVEVN